MPLEQMKDDLLSTHPTLKKLKAQIGIAYAEKKSTDSVLMPDISLRAEYQDGSLYDNDDMGSDTIAYVALTFNPGAGLSSLSNMESAKYKVLQAKDTLRTKEFELKDTLVMDYSDYHSAINRVGSMMRTIESSKKVLASYERLFIAGKRQWLDLVNTSREVTQNYIALATLRASLITSSYRLALQTGNIDFELEGSR
jgi:adhesin transport system outer membrane protein